MIDVFYMNGYRAGVMGLGRSGLSAAKAMRESGAEVWAWDDNEDRRADAAAEGVTLVDLRNCNMAELDTLVWSPGIPHDKPEPHPVASAAKAANVEIVCDIEVLARTQRDASYIGITGTNGKSTTTALIGHILELGGREIEVGGNFGVPALELRPLQEGGTYVLEMSSYQLELTLSITFDVGVLLNISADHLDRHGGLDGYIAAKRLIFHRQTDPRTAVVGVDDEYGRAIRADLVKAGDQIVIPVSGSRRVEGGVYAIDGVLYDDRDGNAVAAVDLTAIPTLPGEHNWQNAAAAYAATCAAGLAPPVVATALQSFPGLDHRQELLAVVDDVFYVNDSKATNADAAGKALASYDHIFWIAGGRAKEGGIESLDALFSRVAHAFLIGEAAEAFADTLDGKVPYTRSGDLAAAVPLAREMATAPDAPKGSVVLLSPACASFDQFDGFEDRGNAFAALVEDLPGEHTDLDDRVPGAAPT